MMPMISGPMEHGIPRFFNSPYAGQGYLNGNDKYPDAVFVGQ